MQSTRGFPKPHHENSIVSPSFLGVLFFVKDCKTLKDSLYSIFPPHTIRNSSVKIGTSFRSSRNDDELLLYSLWTSVS